MSKQLIKVTSTLLKMVGREDLPPFTVETKVQQRDELNEVVIDIAGTPHTLLVFKDPWGGWSTDDPLQQVVEAGLEWVEKYFTNEFDSLKARYFECVEMWESLFTNEDPSEAPEWSKYAPPGSGIQVTIESDEDRTSHTFDVRKEVCVLPPFPVVLVWYGENRIHIYTHDHREGDFCDVNGFRDLPNLTVMCKPYP